MVGSREHGRVMAAGTTLTQRASMNVMEKSTAAMIVVLGLATGWATAAFPENASTLQRVIDAGVDQAQYTVHYDPAYRSIPYPGGDVPRDRGVCSDVIIRAFRKGGVDLQKAVHEDMGNHFSAYPGLWHLRGPDSNIDHRRVANLMTYFHRQGKDTLLSKDARDYLPGDVVAWDLGGGVLHIGMVTNVTATGRRYCVVHNIGQGAKVEDVLFAWRVIGHYRYFR
jgi:uncharacterized protein YijF (DUF1287 family)